jgi:hypothetical protein
MANDKTSRNAIAVFRKEMGLLDDAPLSTLLLGFAWKDLTFHVFPHATHYRETILALNATLAKRLASDLASCHSQKEFDQRHDELCQFLIDGLGVDKETERPVMSYGMAQKVINMAYKYWVSAFLITDPTQISYLHAPVDSYVLQAAHRLGVNMITDQKNSTRVWSKMTKDQYRALENALADKLQGSSRLMWEFSAWEDEIRQ